MSSRRRPAIIAGGVAALLVVVLLVVATRSSSSSSSSSAASAGSPSTAPGTSSSGSGAAGRDPAAASPPTSDPNVSAPPGGAVPPSTPPITPEVTAAPDAPKVPVSLPVAVTVSATSGLADGQAVTVHVVPTGGSQIFGVEARMCKAGAVIDFDADFRPTQTGNCATKPLSANADGYLKAAAAPPYQSVDMTYRVGVGSDSYTTQSGTPVQITCGPDNPCVLAVKLQIPNGFGFQTYPLSFG